MWLCFVSHVFVFFSFLFGRKLDSGIIVGLMSLRGERKGGLTIYPVVGVERVVDDGWGDTSGWIEGAASEEDAG